MSRLGLRSVNHNMVPRNFNPRRIPGCTLWLDSTDATTLWSTNDTSSPVDINALPSNVGRWLDKSGYTNVLTQATSGRRLLLTLPTGVPDSMPALVCSSASGASSDQLDSTIALTALFGAAEMTAMFVIRSTAAGGILGDSTGTNLRVWWPGNTSISATVYNGTGGESTVTKTGLTLSTKYIVCVRRDSSVLAISVDGGTETTVATTGNLVLGSSTLAVPDRNGATKALGWHGDVVLFNRSLNAYDRNRLGRWLASKWQGTWVSQA